MTLPSQPSIQPSYVPQPKTKFGGLAWSALILGIVGTCGSIIPILNNLTAFAAFVGLILGIIAMFGTKKVLAVIGSVLCVLAIVLTVALQAIMVREVDRAFDGIPGGTGDQGQNAPAEVNRLGFGQQHMWKGGETITVSQPQPYKEPNSFLRPPAGKRYVQFDVTVHNGGQREYNVVTSTVTVQHNGRVAQQNYAAGDVVPNVQVPPGGDVAYAMVFEIGAEQGEIQVSVQPNTFAEETVYFVGQV